MKFNKKKIKEKLISTGKAVQKGYGETVRFTQKYAPKAERAFGTVASQVTTAFQPTKSNVEIDLSVRKVRPLPQRRQREKIQLDFGQPKFAKKRSVDWNNLGVNL